MWRNSLIEKKQIWFLFPHLPFPLIIGRQRTLFPVCHLKRKSIVFCEIASWFLNCYFTPAEKMLWNVLWLFVTPSWIHTATALSPKAISLQEQRAPEAERFELCYTKLFDNLMVQPLKLTRYGLWWGHSPTPVAQKEFQGGFFFSGYWKAKEVLLEALLVK